MNKERNALLDEIRKQRYFVTFGPLWFRRLAEWILVFIQRNRTLASVVLKSSLGLLFVILPLALFVYFRVYIPVPTRIPYEQTKIAKQEYYVRSVYPYKLKFEDTTKIFAQYDRFEIFGSNQNDGVLLKAPQYSNAQWFRGLLISEERSPELKLSIPNPIEISGRNKLIFHIKLLQRKSKSCSLILRDSLGRTIGSIAATDPTDNRNILSQIVRITPSFILALAQNKTIELPVDKLPDTLSLTVRGDNGCIIFISEPRFEYVTLSPPLKSGSFHAVFLDPESNPFAWRAKIQKLRQDHEEQGYWSFLVGGSEDLGQLGFSETSEFSLNGYNTRLITESIFQRILEHPDTPFFAVGIYPTFMERGPVYWDDLRTILNKRSALNRHFDFENKYLTSIAEQGNIKFSWERVAP